LVQLNIRAIWVALYHIGIFFNALDDSYPDIERFQW